MAKFEDDFFFTTVAGLNRGLVAGDFSARELAEAYCSRMERLGPRFNALALMLREPAVKQAREVDGDIQRKRLRGPLQGIPFGVKDLLAVKGHPTTWGARPYAGQVFDQDATVVGKLQATGAVLIAKLSMVELAGGGGYRYPAASLQGAGLNPWDRSRWSGGSSSGSGSAVAAGLLPFALGSETSGSILTPSAYCGVTGLRPTYGLVSRAGAMALSWTMDKIGPMCRSAEDCGLVLQAIAGKDGDDPGSAGKSFYYTPQYARAFSDLRVGYAPVDFEEWAEAGARPSFREALETIRGMGFRMVETKLPDFPYGAVTSTIISAEGSAAFEELIESGRVDELADLKQIAGLKAGLEIRAADYLRAMRIRRVIQDALRRLLYSVDVLLSPTRMGVAGKVSDALDAARGPDPEPKSRGMRDVIPAGNLAGLPALSLPCGFVDGLPLAISLAGRPFSENMLLAIGREFQNRTDWHKRHPKL